jgi:hypothetical protein
VGYVVTDVDARAEPEVLAELRAIEGTVRCRVLY